MQAGEKGILARVGRYRYAIVAVVWLVSFVGAFDRALVSVLLADDPFLADLGLRGDPERQGLLMTALLLPYALSNIALGPLVDWWGPRRVIATMVGVWAAAAAAMGAVGSFAPMLIGRVVRGTGEGPLFPVANRFVKYWFPVAERGRANGLWLTGQRLGLALAVPILAFVVAVWGWRAAFFLQAVVLALFVLPFVLAVAADSPARTRRVGAAERAYVAEGLPAETGTAGGKGQDGLGALVRNYRYWLLVFHHAATMAVYVGLITWLPKYLRDERGFDLAGMAFFAALPYVISTAATLVFGFVSDRFHRRAIFCAAGLTGAGLGVWLAALAPDPLVSAGLLAGGLGFWGIATPSYYALAQRIIPGRIVGTGIGIDNGLSNLFASAIPTTIGWLIAFTGSYFAGLMLLAGMGVLGGLAMLILVWQRY